MVNLIDILGVWDVMSNEEVVQFVRTRIAQKIKPAEVSCLVLVMYSEAELLPFIVCVCVCVCVDL